MFNDYILVIGDAHKENGQNDDRFSALGQLIVDLKPKAVVQIGDFGTFDSVTSHEKRETLAGSKLPSLKDDFNSCEKAVSSLMTPLLKLQEKQRNNKSKLYKPELYFVMGNHEDRVRRFVNQTPAMENLLNVPYMMGFTNEKFVKDNKWIVVEYKQYLELDDFAITHVPHCATGPISGVNANRKIASMSKKHVVYGHTHKFGVEPYALIGNDNSVVYTINVGCYLEDNKVENYALGQTTGWSYGVCLLKSNGVDKAPNVFFLTLNQILETYGK